MWTTSLAFWWLGSAWLFGGMPEELIAPEDRAPLPRIGWTAEFDLGYPDPGEPPLLLD